MKHLVYNNCRHASQKKELFNSLRQREYGTPCPYRHDLLVARHIIVQDNRKYQPVFEKQSPTAICYESGRLFFNKYSQCYVVQGRVRPLYTIPGRHKIEDAVLCESRLESLLTEDCTLSAVQPCKPSMLLLSSANWLLRRDLDTGQELQKVFLSSTYKFKHLSWETDGQSIVVKSTQAKRCALARQAGIADTTLLLAVAVFQVFPLQFKYMLEITKQVFGKDLTDAMITHGILITMSCGGLVKMYSMEWITQQWCVCSCKLGEHCGTLGGVVGSTPAGLPVNIKLEECPPVLVQVKCADHSLVMGGIPWHYIITPYGARGVFQVYSVSEKKLAQNGVLDMGELTVEPDKCWFLPDDSGRILHIGASDVRISRIVETEVDSQAYRVVDDFCIQPAKQQQKTDEDNLTVTLSGRIVRRRVSVEQEFDCPLESIQSVDYENELDLLVVTRIHSDGEVTMATIHLHDNSTGELVKKIPLKEPWIEFCQHSIQLDMEVLVHTVKSSGRHKCYVYHLDWTGREEETAKSDSRPRRRSRHSVRSHGGGDVSGTTSPQGHSALPSDSVDEYSVGRRSRRSRSRISNR